MTAIEVVGTYSDDGAAMARRIFVSGQRRLRRGLLPEMAISKDPNAVERGRGWPSLAGW